MTASPRHTTSALASACRRDRGRRFGPAVGATSLGGSGVLESASDIGYLSFEAEALRLQRAGVLAASPWHCRLDRYLGCRSRVMIAKGSLASLPTRTSR